MLVEAAKSGIASTIGHLLWMGAGALVMKGITWIMDIYVKIFGFAFKEGIVAAMKKGRALTPEEYAELKKQVNEKIAKKLDAEASTELEQ